jgi:hypothetical protein
MKIAMPALFAAILTAIYGADAKGAEEDAEKRGRVNIRRGSG